MRARKQLLVLCQELIDIIVDYAHNDFGTLLNCSLASRVFLPSSRFHLFKRRRLRFSQWAHFFDLIKSPLSTITRIRTIRSWIWEYSDSKSGSSTLDHDWSTKPQATRVIARKRITFTKPRFTTWDRRIFQSNTAVHCAFVFPQPLPYTRYNIKVESFGAHTPVPPQFWSPKNLNNRRPSHCCPKFYRSVVKNARMALYLLHSRYFGFDSSTNGHISTPNRGVERCILGELRPSWKVSSIFRPSQLIHLELQLASANPRTSLCHIFCTAQTIYRPFTDQKKSRMILPCLSTTIYNIFTLFCQTSSAYSSRGIQATQSEATYLICDNTLSNHINVFVPGDSKWGRRVAAWDHQVGSNGRSRPSVERKAICHNVQRVAFPPWNWGHLLEVKEYLKARVDRGGPKWCFGSRECPGVLWQTSLRLTWQKALSHFAEDDIVFDMYIDSEIAWTVLLSN